MNDSFGVSRLEGRMNVTTVAYIAFYQSAAEYGPLMPAGEVVEHRDVMAQFPKLQNDVASNVSSATCDENFHD